MDLAQISFFVFAAVATAAAVGVISVKNPVHAVLLLVLTFFSVACTWIIAGAEFLGVALILVYVGAVMVLLLFVVMMITSTSPPCAEGYVRYLPLGLLVAVVCRSMMLTLIGVRRRGHAADGRPGSRRQYRWIARALFTDFMLPFEVGRRDPDRRRNRRRDADPAIAAWRQAPEPSWQGRASDRVIACA
jgi:NADH-quinone oxidoreductase subunit J